MQIFGLLVLNEKSEDYLKGTGLSELSFITIHPMVVKTFH